MSDASGGLGSGTDTTQGDTARANASQQQGNGKLLGDRAGRDVSRPMPSTIGRGSSARDQAAGSRP